MTFRPTNAKFSVSIPAELSGFVKRYQQTHGLGSRSEVITKGLELLREAELAEAYKEHAAAWEHDPDRMFWESAAIGDGLDSGESAW